MPIRLETDSSGRRALVFVPDEPYSAAALAELLTALRWTGTDEIVIDVSDLDVIDMRLAVVLAHAKRHHERLGRRIAIVCGESVDTHALRTAGLMGSGVSARALAANSG